MVPCMRVFKGRAFSKWAAKAGCTDASLRQAADEMMRGLHDGDLGGGIFKKRIGMDGRGKRGGMRTIVAFAYSGECFFIRGYAKNALANITRIEEQALKLLARELLGYTETGLARALATGVIEEVHLP